MTQVRRAPDSASQNGQPPHLAPPQPWASSPKDLFGTLSATAEGLSPDEAERRLREHGPNKLREAQRRSLWTIFFDQLKSLIVLILVAAAAVAIAFGDYIDAAAIGVVLLLNTAIGFFTELRARRSMEALQQMGEAQAVVRRGGRKERIPAEEVVPGDIVVLEAGEVAIADVRVLKGSKLQTDEAALTGESVPVEKDPAAVDEDAPLAERRSMVYKGTAITSGQGEGIVVSTGTGTELGEISELVAEADEDEAPLEERLDQLGRRLVGATLAVLAVVVGAGVLAGRELRLMIETGIALAVAAVPEGLPIVATVALARGMWRMLRKNALIRRLSSVETLGATNVICTDKTGTLTENRMTVQRLLLPAADVQVNPDQNGAEGFTRDGSPADPDEYTPLRRAVEAAVLCNDAELDDSEMGGTGDPMEVALLRLGRQAGLNHDALVEQVGAEVERDAFDRETKKMATVHDAGDGTYRVAVKGAPEAVLDACTHLAGEGEATPLNDEERQEWIRRNEELAEAGLRVLALAEKETQNADEEPYRDLHFLGFVGLLDPPRRDVRAALDRCQDAGIRVVMLTGDQPATARNVAGAVGLVRSGDGENLDAGEIEVVHGTDFGDPEHSDDDRRHVLDSNVFARVSPEQKLRLIDLHQEHGAIVAMTGDGVNDAPALKNADIGVAMGERGTQVAREASDMILQDDAFSTIVAAVEQGRVIFDNIRQFVIYLLSGNVGEILAVAIAALFSVEVGGVEVLPLLPLQILYLNVLNDVFPALALGIGPGDPSVMRHPPRSAEEPIITRFHWGEILGYGALIGATILGVFFWAIHGAGLGPAEVVTTSFLSLSIARLLHVFNMRRPESGFLSNEVTRNPWVWAALALDVGLLLLAVYWAPLAGVLKVTAPTPAMWGFVAVASVVPLVGGQLYLALRRQQTSRMGNRA